MIIGLAVVLVIFLGIVRVAIANAAVENSEKLKNLDRKIAEVESENQLKRERLRARESLLSLEAKALKDGFIKVDKYSFVKPKGPVASALQ